MNELFILQIDPNLLSVTGVIATILAVIFALGALSNSRSRKKHMLELEKAQKEENAMHFRPAKSHLPSRSSGPNHSSRPAKSASARDEVTPEKAPRAAPVAKSSSHSEDAVSAQTSDQPSLFRKVGPDGRDHEFSGMEDEDQELYVWE